ncbi:nucleotide-binding universal stress UspA family protein [Kineococcus radiotolerans]|uniref:UspA domain protein n=2 Tax=Kineococcus radiotolerans TaxID=131568 RepID=A6W879_KINRD|nr:universal stress protein [Kineococcus radiotolerans]ABS03018.1 UspA domain protein [Kineococcus radiotolerans SRS30216 = ATCC BAA-149]MBB2899778.1 nucleotide-binding universal stress UspA family protein [Kineococcus radiotolerans]
MGIVVGYVANPEGRAALGRAGEAAVHYAVPLVVVHSRRPGREVDAAEAERLAEVHESVRAELTAAGLGHELREVPDSEDPADDLILAAEETGASLIVIGLRRRTPVGKLILGASAQRILLDAPCPVLAVKPED